MSDFWSSNTWSVIGGVCAVLSVISIPIILLFQHKKNYKSYNSQEFKDAEVALHILFEDALSVTNLPENERNDHVGTAYQNEMNENVRKVIVLLRVLSERERERERDKAIASKLKGYLELFVEEINQKTFFKNRESLLEQFGHLRKTIR